MAISTKPKAPAALTFKLVNDTGANKTDSITNDAHLKLSKLDLSATIQWRINSTDKWQTVDSTLLTIDTKTKTGSLDAVHLFDGDFIGKLELSQKNPAGESNATGLKLTYDSTAPNILDIGSPTIDTVPNGKTSIVRLTSSEKLSGLDKNDFTLSDTKLASISSIKEVKLSDGMWAYDVNILAAAAKNGVGAVSLTLASNAAVTDLAGNTADFSDWTNIKLADLWIGKDNPIVSLVADTGSSSLKNFNKDNITHNGDLKLTGIKTDANIEFHIKAGSASLLEGADGWMSIDGLEIMSNSTIVNVEELYELAGIALEDIPFTGWKDTFEFRQVPATGAVEGKTYGTTAFTMTYDNTAELFWGEPPLSNEIEHGQSAVISFSTDEKLFGLDKNDFVLTAGADLASIVSVKESQIKDDYGMSSWVYGVTIKAASTGEGNVTLAFVDGASAVDAAGNEAYHGMDSYSLWVIG